MAVGASWPEGSPPYVGYALVRVAHLLTQRMDRRLAELGLTATAFGVLYQLENDPDVSSAELARQVLMTPQSVGPLLARLERDGLVKREPTGARGTRILTRITAEGRARFARAEALVDELDGVLVGGLARSRRPALGRELWDMLARLGPPPGA